VCHAWLPGGAEEQGVHRPRERRKGADRDEGVHCGRRVAQVGPGGLVERPPAVGDYRRREDGGQPLPVGELQHRHHGHCDDGHGEGDADPQPQPQPPYRVLLVGVAGGSGRARRGWSRQPRGVADLLHGCDQVIRRHGRGEGDPGPLSRVVHRGGNPVELVELLLDPCRARRACHAADLQLHQPGYAMLSGCASGRWQAQARDARRHGDLLDPGVRSPTR